MKKVFAAVTLAFIAMALSGCLANSRSPIGANCISGVPLNDMPITCNGGA